MWKVIKEDELYHHGIKGQKWGVRRFQNPDGTLTAAGKRRAYKNLSRGSVDYGKTLSKSQKDRVANSSKALNNAVKTSKKAYDAWEKDVENRWIHQAPKNNVVSFTEDTFMEEVYRDTESRRAMDKATAEEKKAYKEFRKVGQEVSSEILGKYASKPVRDFAAGKTVTAGEKMTEDLLRRAFRDPSSFD